MRKVKWWSPKQQLLTRLIVGSGAAQWAGETYVYATSRRCSILTDFWPTYNNISYAREQFYLKCHRISFLLNMISLNVHPNSVGDTVTTYVFNITMQYKTSLLNLYYFVRLYLRVFLLYEQLTRESCPAQIDICVLWFTCTQKHFLSISMYYPETDGLYNF